ncbi:hypothetical protein FIBSPDRAFT_849562 [Athelia psychrophila]|uniref:Uncharacterized protein n=1 Tax=Athelia psychrophila TaxID=1759441 RepID=A0A166UDT5_9AGAM|nr:hypothetical protein FIBSPDRAFT_849562 [Fibularhizoctonia sp. CBS 109695]
MAAMLAGGLAWVLRGWVRVGRWTGRVIHQYYSRSLTGSRPNTTRHGTSILIPPFHNTADGADGTVGLFDETREEPAGF